MAHDENTVRVQGRMRGGVEQQVAEGQGVRAGAGVAAGFGEHGPTACLGEAYGLAAPVGWRIADHDERPLRPVVDRLGRAGGHVHNGPGCPVGAAVEGLVPGVVRVGDQGFTEREVEVHRAGVLGEGAAGGDQGAGGEPADVRRQVRPLLGGADLVEEPNRSAVQADLVDGLVGTGGAQLRRAVGREDHDREAGLRGLEDRGVHVGRGRAAGRDHGDWCP